MLIICISSIDVKMARIFSLRAAIMKTIRPFI